MIADAKSTLWIALFHVYNRRLLRRNFHNVYVRGHLTLNRPEQAVLLCLNHVSWWDGLVLFAANQSLLRKDAYAVMSEMGLTQYPFFRRLGAFSINRNSGVAVRKTLRRTHELLTSSSRAMVCFFPQGAQRHQEMRPLGFLPGIGALVRSLPLRGVDVRFGCLHYTFLEDRKPDVFFDISEPVTISAQEAVSARTLAMALQTQMEAHLARQSREIQHLARPYELAPAGYEPLFVRAAKRGKAT